MDGASARVWTGARAGDNMEQRLRAIDGARQELSLKIRRNNGVNNGCSQGGARVEPGWSQDGAKVEPGWSQAGVLVEDWFPGARVGTSAGLGVK
jgi:hypothetical protein